MIFGLISICPSLPLFLSRKYKKRIHNHYALVLMMRSSGSVTIVEIESISDGGVTFIL